MRQPIGGWYVRWGRTACALVAPLGVSAGATLRSRPGQGRTTVCRNNGGRVASLENVEVRPIAGEELQLAAGVAARGMRDNPLHVAAIGDDPERRVRVMQRVFATLLTLPGRSTLGAWDGDRLVGVADAADPGRCQPSPRDRLRVAPALMMAGTATPRMSRWLSAWAKHDPDRPHSHFGPLAVDPELQGRGIGSLLLATYCRQLDVTAMLAYLETDKPENVRLYERFGFVVSAEADVIGVKNWFMTREARAHASE